MGVAVFSPCSRLLGKNIRDMDRGNSLEHTPTWAVSLVCLFIFLISFTIETVLHYLTKLLKRRKRKSLDRALAKIKTEMMKMGFISFLLAISEAPISKICVSEAIANSHLPCKDPEEFNEPALSTENQIPGSPESITTLSVEYDEQESFCEAKGMVSLISREGVMQLNIFISVLAVFHILYCVLTMSLGLVKMKRWKTWEEETRSLEYQIANDPMRFRLTRQTSFGQRHLKLWSNHFLLLWPFSGSASKADYFTLRNAFILANVGEGSNFNFQKFLGRAFDDDFERVVGIRFWIWIVSILFIFFNAHRFYNHYWLPFLPLVIILVVGAKLQVIITKMCVESHKNSSIIRGSFHVKPSDELFWFGRPKWLLHLLQLVLIQNSFQLAFFAWTLYEYGLRSCFDQGTEDFAIRIVMGAFTQLLCGYLTLPLYTLVAQMGSSMNSAIFTESVARGLKHWHHKAKVSLARDESTSTKKSPNSSLPDTINASVMTAKNEHPLSAISYSCNEITEDDVQPSTRSTPTPEISQEKATPETITGRSYDGEISFGSSWRQPEPGNGIGEISPVIEEDTSSSMLTKSDEQHMSIS
ncbi:MLO-like protein 12 isoform X2 [Herrania umbratica]|uniref:MLO-like protein n=1 Tax=Herrania umbratica TaxID=108875 RepID=A0A6J1BGE9_9ROSI|nr:MLO-like protein 12 isoform X2 [Herrania umbratica]